MKYNIFFEHDFIDSSYANRKGKGTHKAVREIKYHLVRGGKDRQRLYFLKMDIKGFFRNIDKNILWNIVEKKIQESSGDENWKKEVLWLARKIIFHDPASNYIFKGKEETKKLIPREKSLLFGDRNTGLPIGNLTSQFFANIYLNGLDHFVKDKLGFARYIRYVDDFIILDEDKESLKEATNEVGRLLNHSLKLNLCESKTILQRVERGIDFLGYFIKPSHTLVRRKVVGRFKNKIVYYKGSLSKKQDNKKDKNTGFVSSINSYFGHFIHANSFRLRKVVWERKLKEMKIFEVGDGFEKVGFKK